VGVHPAEAPSHQITFMCDDIQGTVADLRAKGVRIDGEPEDQRFGITVMMTLPGDVKVMLYEPHHPMAITPS
jgi:hypothetical protein